MCGDGCSMGYLRMGSVSYHDRGRRRTRAGSPGPAASLNVYSSGRRCTVGVSMSRRNKMQVSAQCLSLFGATIVVASIVLTGCGSSYSNPGTTAQPTTYDGTFTAAGGANGTLSLTITPPAAALQHTM